MASLKRSCRGLLVPLALGYALAASAQPPKGTDNLDVTMTLLPESAQSPEPITRQIELPPAENPSAEKGSSGEQPQKDQSSPPLEGPGQGPDTAAEARERGREFGQDVAEQAQQNRENAGRSGAPDAQPPNVPPVVPPNPNPPNPPSPPGPPGPPNTPQGPGKP